MQKKIINKSFLFLLLFLLAGGKMGGTADIDRCKDRLGCHPDRRTDCFTFDGYDRQGQTGSDSDP